MLRPHLQSLAAVFAHALADSSATVRAGALRAVAALSGWVESDAEASLVSRLVPAMLAAGAASLQSDDDEGAVLLFSVLDELVESPTPLLQGHLPALLELCVGVATQTSRAAGVRASALGLAAWVANYKPRSLVKHRLLEPLLRAVCPLCAESEAGEEEEEEESLERELHCIACRIVDVLATKLPAKHVAPVVLSFASVALGSASAADRRAALTALAYAAEGCAAAMRPKVAALVPPVAAGLRDPEPEVRAAAAFCLGQFCEHLSPDVLALHHTALPLLMDALGDPAAATAERVLYAVDEWMGSLEGEDLEAHLPRFLEYVIALLDAPGAPAQLQETALSAAASAAASSGRAFHPFLHALMPRLTRCLGYVHDAGLPVRARALECLGTLLVAKGGREAFAALLPASMDAAAAGFSLDYSELREYGHGFYAAAAQAVGPQLAPWLAGVVAQALASLALDDGMSFEDDSSGGESEEEEEGDEGDEGRARQFSVRTGVLDEKSAASCALGEYAKHCGPAFLPHLEAVLPVLLRMSRYFHEQVRTQAYQALAQCVACACACGVAPSPDALDGILSALAVGAEGEDDKEAAAAAIESAALVLRSAGSAPAVQQHTRRLADAVLAVLARRAPCQAEAEDTDSEAGTDDECDEEAAEEILLAAISELLPALATTMGAAAFVPLFGEHFNALMRRGSAGAPEGERAEVAATLVEVVRALGPAAAPCVPLAMPFALREMGCSCGGNRRNAVFLAGILATHTGGASAPQLSALLAALLPLLGEGEADGAVRDNAAATACRLLLAPPAPLPERELLHALLAALPLREDLEELGTVYGGLCELLRRQQAHLAPFTPRIVQLFGALAVEPAGDDEAAARDAVLRNIGATLAAILASPDGTQLRALLGALPQPHAQALCAISGQPRL